MNKELILKRKTAIGIYKNNSKFIGIFYDSEGGKTNISLSFYVPQHDAAYHDVLPRKNPAC